MPEAEVASISMARSDQWASQSATTSSEKFNSHVSKGPQITVPGFGKASFRCPQCLSISDGVGVSNVLGETAL